MPSHGQQDYVTYLRNNVIGPKTGDEHEVLSDSPVYSYLTGMLFPVEEGEGVVPDPLDEDLLPGEAIDAGVGEGTGEPDPTEDDVDDDLGGLAAATGWAPSSMGLSFVHDARELIIRVRAARYERSENEAPSEGTGGADGGDDGAPTSGWRRLPLPETAVTVASKGSGGYELWDGLARLQWRSRPGKDEPIVTVALSNATKVGLGKAKSSQEQVLFQAGFSVEAVTGEIRPYPGSIVVNASDEDRELDFRYRNNLSYGVGHGVAATWGTERPVMRIETDSLPTEIVRPVMQRFDSVDDTLTMAWLAKDAVAPDEVRERLSAFVDNYAAWVEKQRTQADSAAPVHLDAAQRIVTRMDEALARMRAGIDLLATDDTVRAAFCIANEAMRMQAESPRNANPTWRPFQLAFILMALPSTVDDTHDDRDLVDLIWFPTGGGKTEAYLGLAAVEMVRRRLARGFDGGGTAVVTRYTMRLLTAQQFQRAAKLICALELLRRGDGPLKNAAPFSIGLLLGNSTTPGTYKAAHKQLDEVKQQLTPQSPFQLRSCPWCDTPLLPPRRSRRDDAYGFHATDHTFTVYCVDATCPFASSIPVQVVDEAIYQNPPTIVVATVDKFARLAWTSDGGSIFGLDNAPFDPPSLIIQDELHLISGPLGTVVGIYEAAVRALLRWRGTSPKVVASTATIRSADEQVRGLMASKVAVFPPSGLDADDNYFAKTDPTAPGRLYVGLMPQAFAPAWSIGQLAGRMLAAADAVDLTPEERDAYWTLVLYHNSLRELGRTVTILRDDVRDNLQRDHERGLTGRTLSADGVFELTSNVSSHELVGILERLATDADEEGAIDALAATNILSVGIDVARLGLMMVNGQPKTTSEYIQATSRVGRDKVPGIVVTLYRSGKARDRSTFESFRNYHGAFYRFVEPTSVTPWAVQARRRALRAALVILTRHAVGLSGNDDASLFDPDSGQVGKAIDLLVQHIAIADPRERFGIEQELRDAATDWGRLASNHATPLKYSSPKNPDERLLKNFGDPGHGWPTMHSMRSVDKAVRIRPQGERA
ncbi:Distinct helicase family with a unique C-terminal domain including a metal-binding cysteine cluster [Cellulosimicrobium cellulans J34]|nr:Distinct helicase family with a unique C-terminal domain including a metal-binding cysteine cluster [Cellulosimicrobium cellulans J34]SMF03107.1 Distinct helicase family with a unique C-terminal domain including a metal-binding cysteine cluster [Cellulosimicrobium cellulans J1]